MDSVSYSDGFHGGQNNSCLSPTPPAQDIHILTPATYKYVILHSKGELKL